MTRIGFLLFDGFSNMVLSCLLEPLRAVRDHARPDIHWQVLTPDGRAARSSSGLTITPDDAPAADFDMLVIVAGYGFRDHAHARTQRLLVHHGRAARILVGADTGAWLIAAAGLLHEQKATLHWSLLADFAEAFPQTEVSRTGHVKQGRVWTCGGAAGALDLMLAYIGDSFGAANAFIASSMFLHDAEREQPQVGRMIGKGSARLRQVVNLMASTLEAPLPLARLGASCGLSTSKLDRLFKSELGLSPGRYYQMMRLTHARDLAASTDFNLREIALRCGYGDAPALCKAYRQTMGHPIRHTE